MKTGGVKLRKLLTVSNNCLTNPVSYCNGLVCLSLVVSHRRLIKIVNPSRRQTLITYPPIKLVQSIKGHGFGFDSLTKEYKVVCIVKELECPLVYTLGTNSSWREITDPYPLSIPIRNRKYAKSAVSCNGALYWRCDNPLLMLSFDLHDEKFQYIEVPVECDWTEHIWVHYLEYKGYLCFARLEKFGSQNCKVHMHMLKDKIKQIWIKETFVVPFRCDHDTHIMCFCD
ncbi:F-box associated domain [Macleaya cordata]|uniref:F-box associated domain n=1 Tax=Macleaya cordata TaxID=56857 RepID=A0A200Q9G2_MACCD|nr:F-box associated domain [Macleaya cordata]